MNKFFAPLLIALGLASCTAENVAPDCLDRSHITRGLGDYTLFIQSGDFGDDFETTFTPMGNVQAVSNRSGNVLTGAFAVQCESLNVDFDNDELGVLIFEQQLNGNFTYNIEDAEGEVIMSFVIVKN